MQICSSLLTKRVGTAPLIRRHFLVLGLKNFSSKWFLHNTDRPLILKISAIEIISK